MKKFNFCLPFPYPFIIRSHNSPYDSIKKDEKAFLLSHLWIRPKAGSWNGPLGSAD
ncbi:hypothetical protein [uncultured Dialister sp.]|uniref:hypothetical protein n=1 Tax=uncultured Dialister sp. TaxID=278064 RepID=UPI0026DBBBF8|nr:hypothetical protein [uncultured Dialister sp.]